jgi:thioester reductase-like protein
VSPAARPAAVARDTILLTGATGFLGARLLRALRAGGHRVVALVRAPTDEAAQRRVGDDAQALAADVSASRFRLAPRVYEALAARTSCVVHLAAHVSLAASYETLAPTNVDGALHALAFAHLAGAPIVHASTLSVFVASDREDVIFREDDDATADCTIAGGYAQTKWVAEQCVRRAPVSSTIVRYGLLTPDTSRFEAPAGDWLVRFVRDVATRGECPRALLDGELGFDATPVDHAVEATVRLVERAVLEASERVTDRATERARERATERRDTTRTFHVAAARPVSARRLIDAMRAEGVRVAVVDGLSSDATGLLGAARAHATERFARHRALDLFAATGVRFDDTHARAAGIVAPAVDDAYLRGCVRAMLRR